MSYFKSIADNIILNVDSYKASHWLQTPPKTTGIFSYIESRGGKYPITLFIGLQAFLKEYLSKPITQEMIDEAEVFWAVHGEPFNKEGWEHILNKHNGYLPVVIRAVPEGSVIPTNNVLVTVENTDPECYWLTSYLETALLRGVWYPTTVATQSWSIKQMIKAALEETGDVAGLPFKLHDFGARGVSSLESAALGGMAHLVNFMGTDTVSGVLAAMKYYNTKDMVAFSIPAAEHSTITSWGRENEVEAYRNMLRQYAKPGALVAIVSDSYDIYNAVDNIWGKELKQEVIDSGATVVIRPDSGEPAVVVEKVARLLDKNFGSVVNNKGYKVLNNVRIIQGDGINETSIRSILFTLKNSGFSADNIAFGMGAALLAAPQRDDMSFAMKASSMQINGEWIDVYKQPITDSGKNSKRGRLTLIKLMNGEYKTIREEEMKIIGHCHEILREVFRDGKILIEDTFSDIRKRAEESV